MLILIQKKVKKYSEAKVVKQTHKQIIIYIIEFH